MIDANEDIRSGLLKAELEERAITEAITKKHGEPIPLTYDKGTKPIDGIFLSSMLNIV